MPLIMITAEKMPYLYLSLLYKKRQLLRGVIIYLNPHQIVKLCLFAPLRNKDGSGYTVSISPPVDFSDISDETAIAARMNKVVEKEILKGVEEVLDSYSIKRTETNNNFL